MKSSAKGNEIHTIEKISQVSKNEKLLETYPNQVETNSVEDILKNVHLNTTLRRKRKPRAANPLSHLSSKPVGL
jgi:hypothetical protein